MTVGAMRWDDWATLLTEYEHWRTSRALGRFRTRSDIWETTRFAEWLATGPAEVTRDLIRDYLRQPRPTYTGAAELASTGNAICRVLAFGRGDERTRMPAEFRPEQLDPIHSSRRRHTVRTEPAERAAKQSPPPAGHGTPSAAELQEMFDAPAAPEAVPEARRDVTETPTVTRPVPPRVVTPPPAHNQAPADLATWDGLLSGYTAHALAAGRSASTVDSYVRRCRTFATHTNVAPGQVTPEILADYLGRDGIGHWYVKSTRVSLRAVLGYAADRGVIGSNPVDGVLITAAAPATSSLTVGTAETATGPAAAGARLDADAFATHPARTWARSQGYRVADTGALAPDLIAAWRAAGSPVVIGTGSTTGTAWSALLVQYSQAARAGGRAASTIRQHSRTIRAFAYWARVLPANVTTAQLRSYLANPAWKPETRRSVRSALVVVLRFAAAEHLIGRDPAATLETVRVPAGVPRPTPENAITAAIAGADPRVRLMILLGAMQGLRRAEIARLRAEDITPHGLHVTGKGGKTRLVPIHPALADELDKFIGNAGPLFPAPYGQGRSLTPGHVGRLIAEALPAGWTAHSLRHRFATQAFDASKNIRAVQELLGHSKPGTTARYTAVAEASLIDAVAGVPPVDAETDCAADALAGVGTACAR